MNIALPLSAFHVEEPSRELVELAAIVAALTAVIDEAATGPSVRRLRERAEALTARLR